MSVQYFYPDLTLKKYIVQYIYCKIGSSGKWTQSSMAPPGCAKLAIVLQRDEVLAKENGGSNRKFSPITFVGQVTQFIPFSWYGCLEVFFVIFKPCGAFPLIGIPQEEFKNLSTNFSDIMNSAAKTLEERMVDINQPEELKRIMDCFFLQKISIQTKKQHKRWYQSEKLGKVVELMHANYSHTLSVKEICRQTGYSLSTLERRMKKIVGVTPKQLQRVIRFNRTIKFIDQSQTTPHWSRLAQRFGYYDQAHFIKEFKHFYGLTPEQYLSTEPHFLKKRFCLSVHLIVPIG